MLKRWICGGLLLWSPVALAQEVGALRITSNLFDARVYLDGAYRGKTPVLLKAVPIGTHSVRVELEGYRPHYRDVQVSEGSLAVVRTCLQPQARVIMELEPACEEPKYLENAFLQVSGGFEAPNATWALWSLGKTLASWHNIALSLRGGLITGFSPTMPYDGLYLEPGLLVRQRFTEAIEGYVGLGVRTSLIQAEGVEAVRNYWTANLVLGAWITKRWFVEARGGVLRDRNDPTRKLEVGVGMSF